MLLRSYRNRLVNRLPVAWRTMYNWAKGCLWNQPAESILKPASLSEEFFANRITIATSCAVLAGAVMLRAVLPPYVSLGPLFVFGCAIPTLIINRRWGTIAAIGCSFAVPLTRIHPHIAPFHADAFFWNVVMSFLFLEMYVMVFDYVRRQANALPGTNG